MATIPDYPSPKRDEDWQQMLTFSQSLLEWVRQCHTAPESDEQFQAVMHLLCTLVPRHSRQLH